MKLRSCNWIHYGSRGRQSIQILSEWLLTRLLSIVIKSNVMHLDVLDVRIPVGDKL